MAVGWSHSCGLRVDGTLECWGSDFAGQASPPGGQFTAIAAGGVHSCGVRVDSTLECWGADADGYRTFGQASPPGGRFTMVVAGNRHSCALRVSGTVACWGSNDASRLISPGELEVLDAGVARPPAGKFIMISAAGGTHSCGVRVDGTLECWGSDFAGQASPP
ncbi:MAG: hypothetical protein OXG76_10815 [Acidimicrobiaceae bacterium]|nr:hypothetical protein [Acidimicrobiaceae bacterium]